MILVCTFEIKMFAYFTEARLPVDDLAAEDFACSPALTKVMGLSKGWEYLANSTPALMALAKHLRTWS